MPIDFEYIGLREGRLVDYQWAWDRQREVHARVAAGEIPGRVLLLEHEAVYTAGKQTLPEERPFDGTPVVDVDRGGKITWHGPGQLVGYPIMQLPGTVGVVDHVRRIEQAIIELLAQYGIHAGRVPGRTGVWLPADDPNFTPEVETGPHHAKSVMRTGQFTPGLTTWTPGVQIGGAGVGRAPVDAVRSAGGARGVVPPADAELSGRGPSVRGSMDAVRSAGGARGVVPPALTMNMRPERKICALGIRVTKRTTMHGFGLNISNDTQGFDNIVPCGIPDAGVTSMAAELGEAPSVLEVAERLEPLLARHLAR